MITGPLFKWFGSKWSAAAHYPAPKFSRIYEPFAGSAGYALRHWDHEVWIYDSHPLVAELWQWLIREATAEEILSIPINLQPYSDIRELGLTRGQQLLLKHWQRTDNSGQNLWTISAWCNSPGQWTESTRARVACEVVCVKHWRFGVPEFQPETTYLIDPPYQYNHRYGLPKYNHDELVLSLSLLPSPAQIIACEATCPKTGRVPNYLPFQPFRKQITSRRRRGLKQYSEELLFEVTL